MEEGGMKRLYLVIPLIVVLAFVIGVLVLRGGILASAPSIPAENPGTIDGSAQAQAPLGSRTPVPPPPGAPPTPDATQSINPYLTPPARPTNLPLPQVTPSTPGLPPPAECQRPVAASTTLASYAAPDGSFTLRYPANWTIITESPEKAQWGKTDSVVAPENMPRSCYSPPAFHTSLEGPPPGGLRILVKVYPHKLQAYGDVDTLMKVFAPASATGDVRSEVVVSGQRAVKFVGRQPDSSNPIGISAFAKGDTVFNVIAQYLTTPEYESSFQQILNGISLN
jgi:hypothetical protein